MKIKKVPTILLMLCLIPLFLQHQILNATPTTKKHKPEHRHHLHYDQVNLTEKSPYVFLYSASQVYPPLLFLDLRFHIFQPFKPFQKKPKQIQIKPPKKNFGRALLQLTGHFAYATTSYWVRQDVMKEDWEYQLTWKDQKKRLLFIDSWTFDSNTFQFNWTHSLAGSLYYNYARANRFTPLQSFLFGIGASYFWEFVVEFKEKVSINDSIGTPMGGITIGESMFQLGRFFRSQKPTLLNRLARIVSNPVLSLNELLYKKKNRYQYSFEGIDYWNDFRLYLGPRFDNISGDTTNNFIQVGIETQLNLIPEYGKPEASNRFINHTAFTQFDVGGTLNKKGIYEFNIFAKSVFFGFFIQDIFPSDNLHQDNGEMNKAVTQDDDVRGYSFFAGIGSSFDMMMKNSSVLEEKTIENSTLPDETDKYCIINLLGPTIDFSLYRKNLHIRLNADAYGDFSLIHSHAFKDYSEIYELGKTKSTLKSHGYYYALGITLASLLQVNYSNLEIKGILKYHYFNSIEGLDRFQEDIEKADDVNLIDHRWHYNIGLGYRIPNTSIQLVFGWEQWKRKGSVDDFVRKSSERRSYIQIKYLF